jgi:hypothetical protein
VSIKCTGARKLDPYLIASFEAQSKLIWTLYLSIPPELVAYCVAERHAVVIGERSGRALRQQGSVQSNRYRKISFTLIDSDEIVLPATRCSVDFLGWRNRGMHGMARWWRCARAAGNAKYFDSDALPRAPSLADAMLR